MPESKEKSADYAYSATSVAEELVAGEVERSMAKHELTPILEVLNGLAESERTHIDGLKYNGVLAGEGDTFADFAETDQAEFMYQGIAVRLRVEEVAALVVGSRLPEDTTYRVGVIGQPSGAEEIPLKEKFDEVPGLVGYMRDADDDTVRGLMVASAGAELGATWRPIKVDDRDSELIGLLSKLDQKVSESAAPESVE